MNNWKLNLPQRNYGIRQRESRIDEVILRVIFAYIVRPLMSSDVVV